MVRLTLELRRLEDGGYDRDDRHDGGAIAILVAILSLVLFGIAAIVVDLGMVRVVAAKQQSAADAAALAGAAALYPDRGSTPDFTAAAAAVISSGAKNGIADTRWDKCMAPVPAGWIKAPGSDISCISFDSETNPRRVQVVTPSQPVAAAFGGVFDYSGSDVSRMAQAQARDRALQDCSLCLSGLLDVQDQGQVSVDGNGSLVAKQGKAQLTARVVVTGDGVLAFEEFPPQPGPGNAVWSPDPQRSAPLKDPFAGVPGPDLVTDARPLVSEPTTTSVCDAVTGPGIRIDVIYRNLDINGDCTVANGTLVVTGLLQILPGATLTGTDATIYLACRADDLIVDCGAAPSLGRLDVLDGGTLDLVGGWLGTAPRHLGVDCAPKNTSGSTISGAATFANSSIACTQNNWTVSGGVDITDGLASLGGLRVILSGQVDILANNLGSGPGPFRLALVK